MSWRANLHKLRALPWADRWLALRAFAWLGVLRAAILLLPFRWVARVLGLAVGMGVPAAAPDLSAQAARIGWAVRAAAARTPWRSACLVQALAGAALLRQRRLPGALYLGVAKESTRPSAIAAHAWLRCGDVWVTGESGHQAYAVLSVFVLKYSS